MVYARRNSPIILGIPLRALFIILMWVASSATLIPLLIQVALPWVTVISPRKVSLFVDDWLDSKDLIVAWKYVSA